MSENTNLKRAMVTGASSGIGREFAIQLAQQGYTVVGVARREDNLKELMTELTGEGHSYLVADLAEAADLEKLSQALRDDHFSLLINNAGFSTFEPFYKSDIKLQRKILAVNIEALVELAHAFLSQSKAGDALINLASIVSYLPTPVQPMYSARKSFIAAFSECLWDEHRKRDVYVIGLCPGLTHTEFISGASGGDEGEGMPQMLFQSTTEVVGEALVALNKRKKSIIVSGLVNRLMMLVPRMMTRHALLKFCSYIGDPDKAM